MLVTQPYIHTPHHLPGRAVNKPTESSKKYDGCLTRSPSLKNTKFGTMPCRLLSTSETWAWDHIKLFVCLTDECHGDYLSSPRH